MDDPQAFSTLQPQDDADVLPPQPNPQLIPVPRAGESKQIISSPPRQFPEFPDLLEDQFKFMRVLNARICAIADDLITTNCKLDRLLTLVSDNNRRLKSMGMDLH
jgi:hypothetical protein